MLDLLGVSCVAQVWISVIGILLLICMAGMMFCQHKRLNELKRLKRETEIEEERYRMATELANDVIFEYDIRTDTMQNSMKYKTIFGRNPIIYNYTETFVNLSCIHPQDRAIFMQYCSALHIGKEKIEYEFRIKTIRQKYEWCHIKAKSICGSDNLPTKVIGKISNVDAERRELEKFQFKAQIDSLTNVYNKGATEEIISEILRDSREFSKHAFFVIDIDNFKYVNDTYGHLKGDYVLATLISRLNGMFRSEDVIGRIGGDEFVVFMRNVTSREQIENKAASMTSAFSRRFGNDEDGLEVSGSVGVAIFPMDGTTYKELLNHADYALYSVKNTGKNNFRLYGDINIEKAGNDE